MLEVKSVSFSYRNAVILDDISVTVEPGEICALVAPNGSGKTTLMKVIGAHLLPNRGCCQADGTNSTHRETAYRKKVMYIPDGGKLLHDDLTVYEQLNATKTIWKSTVDLDQIIEQCFISEMLPKKGEELSQGMKQQAGLAIACASGTPYLLFDEPTNGFDQTNSRMFWKTINKLADKDVGVIISSHILNELDEACDSTYFLKDGHLIRPHEQGYQGSCSDIYAQLYEGDER